ncbi:hypothetical protein AO390_04030 [Pseudomonas marginalis ICMP 11289]|nr:hypothetical protein AO390_04030 [Pseudomonas marginalis ICMP 11289]
MSYVEIEHVLGPSAVMGGGNIDLEQAIHAAQARFPGRSFCVVNEWVWLDFDAPEVVIQGLSGEGKKPVMLLVLNALFDSTTAFKETQLFRSTPLIEFSDGMFFQTKNKLYVLIGHGRRRSMSLSAVIRLF